MSCSGRGRRKRWSLAAELSVLRASRPGSTSRLHVARALLRGSDGPARLAGGVGQGSCRAAWNWSRRAGGRGGASCPLHAAGEGVSCGARRPCVAACSYCRVEGRSGVERSGVRETMAGACASIPAAFECAMGSLPQNVRMQRMRSAPVTVGAALTADPRVGRTRSVE